MTEEQMQAIGEKYPPLNFCLCGNTEDVFAYVADLLKMLDNNQWSKYEDLPYMFFVYWANVSGFAEHGTTARCSWLTPEGKALLEDLDKLK